MRLASAFVLFFGAYNYFAYALPSNERTALSQSMNRANMNVSCNRWTHSESLTGFQVLPTFMNRVGARQNSRNISIADLEPNAIPRCA